MSTHDRRNTTQQKGRETIQDKDKIPVILKMNQDNQVHKKDASGNIPMKRNRGRPRKYSRLNFSHGENPVPRDQNLNRRENVHTPPGFAGVNGTRYRPIDAINDRNDVMVGQVVHGVIEAAFDAGYLLNVKVGNSECTLRGIVFKPGQYIPVSADNDVAPNVQMVRRNEIPFPAGNHSHAHGYNARSRERNEQFVNSYRNGTASLGATKGKQAALLAVQTGHPVISKNIYQRVNSSNGQVVAKQPSSVSSQVTHPEASKVNLVTEAVIPSNGSTPTNQVQTVGNQVFPLQAQTSHQGLPSQPHAKVLHEAEAKSMKLPVMPFEKLLNEVSKRIQAPSQSAKTNIGDKKDDLDNSDRALSIEPLQVVQPDVSIHSASVSEPFENFRTGKMTELLRAVQENMMENQVLQTEVPVADSNLDFDKVKNPEVDVGYKENDHSKKQSDASNV